MLLPLLINWTKNKSNNNNNRINKAITDKTNINMISFKSALQEYLAAFDGSNNDFSQIEHLFDALYHEASMCTSKEGKKLTRVQTKMLHSKYLAKGSKAPLLHYKRIGFTCADIKFRMVNGEEDTTIHLVVTIFEHKIAKSWVIDDSFRSTLKAKCASDFYYYWAALLTNDDINNRKLPEEYGTDYTNNGLYTWVSVPQGQPDGGLLAAMSKPTKTEKAL